MNEQIKAIGRQAGFVFIEDGVYGDRWYSSKCGMDALEFEKFAELIVLKCCEVADTLHLYLPPMTAKKLIARHFGLEP